jgi:hypothetical protein
MKCIYLIGSLRNPEIPHIGQRIRGLGFEVADYWFSAGAIADDAWRDYSRVKGLNYKEALSSYEARHVFEFDKYHIDRADLGVLVMPAGRSGHLEAGYLIGRSKPVFALFDKEPERFDVMLQFCTDIFFKEEDLHDTLCKYAAKN